MTGSGDVSVSAVDSAAFVLALRERGVRDTQVLRAMERVPRALFVPQHLRAHARRDIALPLHCGQTMTAPTVVAAMLGALAVPPGARVLEIGTGSGFVTALLVRLGAAHVRSLERYATLARSAQSNLDRAGLAARVDHADGLDRHAVEEGAYDRILIGGSLRELPDHLAAGLAPGGRLVGVFHLELEDRLVVVERKAQDALTRTAGARLRLPSLMSGRSAVL